MKRSLFSLLLVLVLLVAVSAFAVEATAFDCPLCEDEAFAEWDGVTGTGHWLVSADLSLAADVNVSDLHLYIAEGVALNTNGFTLKLENLEEGATESKLAIMGSGTISTTSAVSPITYTAQKGSVYLMGATIDVSGATARAAELVNTSNSFEIKANGKIIGVSASPSSSYEGGSIKVTAGTLTLTQGTITGGHAKYGGNVYVGAGGTFNMDGGTVSHGVVTYHGGNVYMVSTNSSAKAKLIMDGGTIEAGQAAKNGGNICLSTFITFTMNGGTITGNDSDGDNHGYANTQGLNIAILKGGSTSYSGCNVSLNGGTIAGFRCKLFHKSAGKSGQCNIPKRRCRRYLYRYSRWQLRSCCCAERIQQRRLYRCIQPYHQRRRCEQLPYCKACYTHPRGQLC